MVDYGNQASPYSSYDGKSSSVQVTEDTLDEIRAMGMAAAISKAKSGSASPEFMEAVRRFYPSQWDEIENVSSIAKDNAVPMNSPVDTSDPGSDIEAVMARLSGALGPQDPGPEPSPTFGPDYVDPGPNDLLNALGPQDPGPEPGSSLMGALGPQDPGPEPGSNLRGPNANPDSRAYLDSGSPLAKLINMLQGNAGGEGLRMPRPPAEKVLAKKQMGGLTDALRRKLQ